MLAHLHSLSGLQCSQVKVGKTFVYMAVYFAFADEIGEYLTSNLTLDDYKVVDY